jgi:hypothetical protein
MAVNTPKTKFNLYHTQGYPINLPKIVCFLIVMKLDAPSILILLIKLAEYTPKILLGVLLDTNLTFNDHTGYLCNKIA